MDLFTKMDHFNYLFTYIKYGRFNSLFLTQIPPIPTKKYLYILFIELTNGHKSKMKIIDIDKNYAYRYDIMKI